MHEPLLSRAAKPTPVSVLGLLLRPFSLGHLLCLIREGNPLAFGNDGKPQDLAGAVLICSQTWKELERMPFDPLIGLKLWIWRRRVKRMNLGRELAAWVEYREAGSLEPPLSQVAKPSQGPAPRLPGSPFLLRIHQWLMLHLRLTEAEAWDYPYGLAKFRWCAFWEQEQGLEVYNEHDAEFDRFVAEQEAKGAAALTKEGK